MLRLSYKDNEDKTSWLVKSLQASLRLAQRRTLMRQGLAGLAVVVYAMNHPLISSARAFQPPAESAGQETWPQFGSQFRILFMFKSWAYLQLEKEGILRKWTKPSSTSAINFQKVALSFVLSKGIPVKLLMMGVYKLSLPFFCVSMWKVPLDGIK